MLLSVLQTLSGYSIRLHPDLKQICFKSMACIHGEIMTSYYHLLLFTPCLLINNNQRFESCSTLTKVLHPSKCRRLQVDTAWHTQKPVSSAHFPSMPRFSKWSLSFRMSGTKPSMHFSSSPSACPLSASFILSHQ
jgi:hypothetical protein